MRGSKDKRVCAFHAGGPCASGGGSQRHAAASVCGSQERHGGKDHHSRGRRGEAAARHVGRHPGLLVQKVRWRPQSEPPGEALTGTNQPLVFARASHDLRSNMVAADTMEDFQKELDKGKVRGTVSARPRWAEGHHLFLPTDSPDPLLWTDPLRGLDKENHRQVSWPQVSLKASLASTSLISFCRLSGTRTWSLELPPWGPKACASPSPP